MSVTSCDAIGDQVIQMEKETMAVFREAVARIPTGMGHMWSNVSYYLIGSN